MPKPIIPAGYQLSVVSWENDGDHYNTEVMNGLSEEEVKFLVEICLFLWRISAKKIYFSFSKHIKRVDSLHSAAGKCNFYNPWHK